MAKRIVIANDHGAVEIKDEIAAHLIKRGYEVVDMGVSAEEAADYPDQAEKACTEFLQGGYEFGIVCCGTGIGISISANKIHGIRCALPQNCFAAEMTKRHNDANFLAFGGRIDYPESIISMVDAYIDAEYEGGRHARRVGKMMDLETRNC